jgi:hypothetical protein
MAELLDRFWGFLGEVAYLQSMIGTEWQQPGWWVAETPKGTRVASLTYNHTVGGIPLVETDSILMDNNVVIISNEGHKDETALLVVWGFGDNPPTLVWWTGEMHHYQDVSGFLPTYCSN